MVKIKKLTITNYRAIDNLQYSPRQINLIIGRNNAGKTTVMRAIDFLYSMRIPDDSITYPQLEIKNGKNSGIIQSDKKCIKFFKGLENIDSKNQKLARQKLNSLIEKCINEYTSFKKTEFTKVVYDNFDFMTIIESNNNIHFFPYYKKFRQYDKAEPAFKKDLKKINPSHKKGDLEQFGIDFFRIFYSDLFETVQYSVVSVSNEEKLDLTFLEELDKLKTIEDTVKESDLIEGFEKLIEEGVLYKKNDETFLLPYKHYGDGFLVFLNLVYQMIKAKNKILLIEEPENHLHPGYIKMIVEKIFTLSKKFNVQIFITSHSYDFIQEIIDYANKSENGKLLLISLMVQDKGKITKIDYNITQATKNLYKFNTDLRGI